MTELSKMTQGSSTASQTEVGIVLQMADGTIAACDATAEALLGMTIDQLQDASSTNHPWQAIHPDGTPFPGETHPAMVALRTGEPCLNVKMGFYRPDGELMWFKLDARPLFQRSNRHAYAVSVNITPLPAPTVYPLHRIGITPTIQQRCSPNSLQASEQQLLAILDTSSDFIGYAGLDGYARFVNRAGRELVGLDTDDVSQTVLWDYHPIEDHEELRSHILPAVQRDGYWKGDFRLRHFQTNESIPINYHVFALCDPDTQEMLGFATISRDIRNRLEAEVQQQHLLSIINTSSDYIGCANLDGQALFVNRAGLELVGLDADQVPQTQIIDYILPEDRDFVQTEILPTVLREGYWKGDFRLRNFQTDEAVAIDYHVFPLTNPNTDETVGFATISRDIRARLRVEDERLRAEAKQLANDARLRCFVESNIAGVIVANLQGDFLEANDVFLKMIGYSREEFEAGQVRWIDITPPEWAEADRQAIVQIRTTGSCPAFEKEYIRKDGSRVPILAGVAMLPGEQEECFCFVIDLSQRKQAEQERAEAVRQLATVNLQLEQQVQEAQAAKAASDRANRIKDDFLAVLSHELRSPLNPILGWSKLIKSGRLEGAKLQDAIAIIERNAQLQSQLIEDLLDISRILQGKLTLNQQPVNLEFVITAALETVRLAAEAKQIKIATELETSIGQVLGDAGRLQQVVWNLLTNAVKFTPEEGSVTVRLAKIESQAQIQVTDTGKGISPKFLPHVFERFCQEDGSTTRKFGGLGLGLAIVRQLVELQGGTIQVESQGENQGATFTVWLPLLDDANPFMAEANPSDSSECNQDCPLADYQILVVDDDPDSREFVAFVLEQSGAIVVQAASAVEALDYLSRDPFNALVSDVGMPEMNGYMLIQQVRARTAAQGGQIPALAVTAYAGEMNAQQAVQAGFEQHLAKPIDPDALIATVAKLCATSVRSPMT